MHGLVCIPVTNTKKYWVYMALNKAIFEAITFSIFLQPTLCKWRTLSSTTGLRNMPHTPIFPPPIIPMKFPACMTSLPVPNLCTNASMTAKWFYMALPAITRQCSSKLHYRLSNAKPVLPLRVQSIGPKFCQTNILAWYTMNTCCL